MESRLQIDIQPQPDDFTCGPTCLQAIYRYFGDEVPIEQLLSEVEMLDTGGTLAVHLACHALRRGYRATLYTYNLRVFDPTWFRPGVDLKDKLAQRLHLRAEPRLHGACAAYLQFVTLGGRIDLEDLTPALIRRYLKKDVPILTGLSSTWLYRDARESGPDDEADDVGGDPQGHFVVLCGYDSTQRLVLVADPYEQNPVSGYSQRYEVPIERALCAILVGLLTYDGNLLIITPLDPKRARREPLDMGDPAAEISGPHGTNPSETKT